MTGTVTDAPRDVDRRRTLRRRGRAWGLVGCGVALAAPAALLVVRLTGLDAGTPLAMPMVLFPYSTVLGVLVLGVMVAVPALRSRWAVAVVGALVVAHVALLAPRFVPERQQVPADSVELRVASINAGGGGADPRALVELVRTERIDVLAVEQLPSGGVDALDKAGLGTLMPYQELHPEYDSSIYSRHPLSHVGTTHVDTAWPQTTAKVAVGGHRVQFVAVHTYYPLGDAKRWARDMTALTSVARRSGPDAVFLGDFNASLDHTPMRRLLAAGLTDTHAELGRGWARTWPVGHALVPPLIQLDHVLHGPGLMGVSVGERTVPGTDHRAVVAVLALLPEKGPTPGRNAAGAAAAGTPSPSRSRLLGIVVPCPPVPAAWP
ncbi:MULTISPECIES: endonuclease/exonuclease/phosphatase family protein [unclassified Streptomyces]|uniref:endonuclease/exonuclease/phosphatase family protein n=1 Tax=unclassified Streptomyces TaxID=2593676 RepID=UPI002DD85EA2|nr:endonuclease/exonuclease/phosphatase family protein [Streptomyces sp. NBC_01761]WSC51760.1 endonuclease/exonuclease/phosphatase family protein [Streptomyces sp. NBC_01761]